MSKLKTKSGAKKRFRARANGYKYRNAERSHILTKKAQKRKRQHRGQDSISAADVRSIRRMLTGS